MHSNEGAVNSKSNENLASFSFCGTLMRYIVRVEFLIAMAKRTYRFRDRESVRDLGDLRNRTMSLYNSTVYGSRKDRPRSHNALVSCIHLGYLLSERVDSICWSTYFVCTD